ncbi:MAG: LuxR C-terminal-related transcriptional regulator [Alphaproteobacteria bacterium]|nr:LuxR C-terminal-related transcriptional regulator [Alphaproteobacteria bacterium]MCI5056297.1 LuxR C-terminal-related transcriptional regulator [Flavobacteriales bacterium]
MKNRISLDVAYAKHLQEFTFPCLSKVNEISSPILELLGINFFCFHRIYDSGKAFVLHSNKPWVKFFNENKYSQHLFNTLSYLQENSQEMKFIFWNHWGVNQKLDPVFEKLKRASINDFSIDDGLMLMREGKGFVDFFDFAADAKKEGVYSSYMRYFSYIEKFCVFFASFSTQEIERNKDKAIILPDQDHNRAIKTEDRTVQSFKRKLKNYIYVEGMSDYPHLTQQQLEVSKGLLLGKSCKAIARSLRLSPRTVESHTQIVKEKFQCFSKDQLQEELWQMPEMKRFIFDLIFET